MSNKNNSVAVVFGAVFLLAVVGLGGYVLAQRAGLIEDEYNKPVMIQHDTVEEANAHADAKVAQRLVEYAEKRLEELRNGNASAAEISKAEEDLSNKMQASEQAQEKLAQYSWWRFW
ncbi:MAG: hypothetical protein N0C90_12875 [Candidatus Thiodiazotropha endolucinida]|nr:hypothetical protein [Candidatus Thiodiazotropha taylori]MCW4262254.1 hypothetical protein [Candidatus Thiodiazotropha endolucinida]